MKAPKMITAVDFKAIIEALTGVSRPTMVFVQESSVTPDLSVDERKEVLDFDVHAFEMDRHDYTLKFISNIVEQDLNGVIINDELTAKAVVAIKPESIKVKAQERATKLAIKRATNIKKNEDRMAKAKAKKLTKAIEKRAIQNKLVNPRVIKQGEDMNKMKTRVYDILMERNGKLTPSELIMVAVKTEMKVKQVWLYMPNGDLRILTTTTYASESSKLKFANATILDIISGMDTVDSNGTRTVAKGNGVIITKNDKADSTVTVRLSAKTAHNEQTEESIMDENIKFLPRRIYKNDKVSIAGAFTEMVSNKITTGEFVLAVDKEGEGIMAEYDIFEKSVVEDINNPLAECKNLNCGGRDKEMVQQWAKAESNKFNKKINKLHIKLVKQYKFMAKTWDNRLIRKEMVETNPIDRKGNKIGGIKYDVATAAWSNILTKKGETNGFVAYVLNSYSNYILANNRYKKDLQKFDDLKAEFWSIIAEKSVYKTIKDNRFDTSYDALNNKYNRALKAYRAILENKDATEYEVSKLHWSLEKARDNAKYIITTMATLGFDIHNMAYIDADANMDDTLIDALKATGYKLNPTNAKGDRLKERSALVHVEYKFNADGERTTHCPYCNKIVTLDGQGHQWHYGVSKFDIMDEIDEDRNKEYTMEDGTILTLTGRNVAHLNAEDNVAFTEREMEDYEQDETPLERVANYDSTDEEEYVPYNYDESKFGTSDYKQSLVTDDAMDTFWNEAGEMVNKELVEKFNKINKEHKAEKKWNDFRRGMDTVAAGVYLGDGNVNKDGLVDVYVSDTKYQEGGKKNRAQYKYECDVFTGVLSADDFNLNASVRGIDGPDFSKMESLNRFKLNAGKAFDYDMGNSHDTKAYLVGITRSEYRTYSVLKAKVINGSKLRKFYMEMFKELNERINKNYKKNNSITNIFVDNSDYAAYSYSLEAIAKYDDAGLVNTGRRNIEFNAGGSNDPFNGFYNSHCVMGELEFTDSSRFSTGSNVEFTADELATPFSMAKFIAGFDAILGKVKHVEDVIFEVEPIAAKYINACKSGYCLDIDINTNPEKYRLVAKEQCINKYIGGVFVDYSNDTDSTKIDATINAVEIARRNGVQSLLVK